MTPISKVFIILPAYNEEKALMQLIPKIAQSMDGAKRPYAMPRVTTYTNGFRAYRMSIVRKVHEAYGADFMKETGFPGGTEFFLKCAAEGGVMTEIPFHLHYENRGASKIRIGPTIAKYLKLVLMAYRLS